MSFKEFFLLAEIVQSILELDFYLVYRRQQRLSRRHVVRLREDRQARHAAHDLPGQRIEIGERFDLVVEQLEPHGVALGFCREDIDDIATHPVIALRQVELIALVLHLGQAAQDRALIDTITARQV